MQARPADDFSLVAVEDAVDEVVAEVELPAKTSQELDFLVERLRLVDRPRHPRPKMLEARVERLLEQWRVARLPAADRRAARYGRRTAVGSDSRERSRVPEAACPTPMKSSTTSPSCVLALGPGSGVPGGVAGSAKVGARCGFGWRRRRRLGWIGRRRRFSAAADRSSSSPSLAGFGPTRSLPGRNRSHAVETAQRPQRSR